MIAGLDSSFFRPSQAQALQAKANGVGVWGGYLASRSRVGLASPWDLASFDTMRVLPGTPIGFCSGWDDPVACSTLAKAWKIRLCLDVEGSGLRDNGAWVQGWLDAAGRDFCGLYGNAPVFPGRVAAFYVIAGYPGYDPGRSWGYIARPNGPCGWQWRGSHDEYGGGVDRSTLDDWFATGAAPIEPEEEPMAYCIQGDQKPHCWITDGLSRRWLGDIGELAGWLQTTKRPLERKRQFDVDRIPVSFRVPEDLTGTGLHSYDDVVFGPAAKPPEVTAKLLAASVPADDAWAPSDQEVKALHEQLGFYPVVGADHKA